MSRVVFVLVQSLHLLDLAGPAQAFWTATDLGYDYELRYVGVQSVIRTAQGVPLTVTTRWPDLDAADLLIVPGWRAAYRPQPTLDAESRERLVAHHARGGTVASVCSGAFGLGAAGLLDGRRCTTHHELQAELARRYPRASVVPDVLYTTDERVVTSAGIASGIDLALHLIAVRDGASAAARVAHAMVVYARRNGDEPQASAMLRHRSHLSEVVHQVQDNIDARFTETLPLAELAGTAGISERTLTRLFTSAAGVTPLQYQHALRIERAEHLIGHGSTVDAAARAVGFSDARMLRRLRSRSTRAAADRKPARS